MEAVQSSQKAMDASQTSDPQTSSPTHLPRRPLPRGRVYHFNVVYNHAKSKLARTADTEISLDWTRRAVEWLQLLGLVNSYYHDRDCPAGQGLVQELARVLAGSEVTVVVLSPGFVRDCWPRYSQLTSFKALFNAGPSPSPSASLSSFQSSSYSSKSSNASDRFSPKGENRFEGSEDLAESHLSSPSTKSFYSSPGSVYSTTDYSSNSYSKTSGYSSRASSYSTSSFYSSSISLGIPQPSSSAYSAISSASPSPFSRLTFEPVASDTSSQERSSGRVILVALGLDQKDLPSGVKASDVLYFAKDWQGDDEAWSRLRTTTLTSLPAGGTVWNDEKDEDNASVVMEESERSSRECASITVQLPKGTESRHTVLDMNGNCDQEKEDRKSVTSPRAEDHILTSRTINDSAGSLPLGTKGFYETSRREYDSGETSTDIGDTEKSSGTSSSSRLSSSVNGEVQKYSEGDTYLPANHSLGTSTGTATSYVEESFIAVSNTGANHRVYSNCNTSPGVNNVGESSAIEVPAERADGVDSRHSPLSEESPGLHLIHQHNMTASQDPLPTSRNAKPDAVQNRMMDTNVTPGQFSNIPSTEMVSLDNTCLATKRERDSQFEESVYGPSKDKKKKIEKNPNPPRIPKAEVEFAVLDRLCFTGVKREAWNISAVGLNRETTKTDSDSSSPMSSLECEVGSRSSPAEYHGQQTQMYREAQGQRDPHQTQTSSASQQTLVKESIQTTRDSPSSVHYEENPDGSENPTSPVSSGSELQVTPVSVTLGESEHPRSVGTPGESDNAGSVPSARYTIGAGSETLSKVVSSLSEEIKTVDVVDSGVIDSAGVSHNTAGVELKQSGERAEPQVTVTVNEVLSYTLAKPSQPSCKLTNRNHENHTMEETSTEISVVNKRSSTLQHSQNDILVREGIAESATLCQYAAPEMRVSNKPTTEDGTADNSTAHGQMFQNVSEKGGYANLQCLGQSKLKHTEGKPQTQAVTTDEEGLLTHPETNMGSETLGEYKHITSIEDDHIDFSFNSDFLSTSLTSDYGTMSPRNDLSGNSDSGFLSLSSVGDCHLTRNALQTAASPRVRDIIRGLGELDSGLDLLGHPSENTREQSYETEMLLKDTTILTKENKPENTSAISNHSGNTGQETQSETVIAKTTLDEQSDVQNEQSISQNSQKTTFSPASDHTISDLVGKNSDEYDTKYSQHGRDVLGFVRRGGDHPDPLKVDSQVQGDAALDVFHGDDSFEVKDILDRLADGQYTKMDTWKCDDVDKSWSWGELLLPLYRVMVYALSKPEMPYF